MQRSTVTNRRQVNLGRIILAVLLGVTAGAFISGYWLIDYFPAESRQLLFFTLLFAAVSALGYYAGAGAFVRCLSGLNAPKRILAIALGALLGCFLFFAGTSRWQSSERYVAFLLPRHQFGLVADGARQGTAIVWLSTSLGDISYDSIAAEGWVRRGDQLVLVEPAANSLEWSAATGEKLQLVLETSQPGGQVHLAWGGREQVIPLNSRKTTYEHAFVLPFVASRTLVILLGLLNFWAVATGILLAATGMLPAWLSQMEQAVAHQRISRVLGDEILIVGLAACLALLLRAFNLGGLFPAVDEYYHLIAANQILEGTPLDSVYPRGLWVVTLPIALALRAFGHEVWAARAIGVLFNVLAVVPLYLLARKISRPVAAVACMLYATSPWIITFGRVAREYAYYPFYFYWIAYAMILFVEAVPSRFIVGKHWKGILRSRVIILAAILTLPPIFALAVDWLSTFRTILIAYLVFGAFVLMRFDWKERANWPWLGATTVVLVAGGLAWYREQLTKLLLIPRVNRVPLEYFFPNPQQQWYYERIAVVMVLGVALAITASVMLRRVNFVPLFFVSLFVSYLAVFALISKSFFHTRHLMSTQFWYVVVSAMGLYWLWDVLRRASPWRGRAAAVSLAVMVAVSALNPWQVALPSVSTDPDMPISEDYLHDLSAVQAYMLGNVGPQDVLIATVYGLYATWEGEPTFSKQYRITSHTTREEVRTIVAQHASGWIVLDDIRLNLSPLSVRDFADNPQIEYIGVFGDEHVWRWERSAWGPGGAVTESKRWTFR
ncbi:MAG: hypothetical protein V1755_03840 [Chloroflexota bacterium]